VANRPPGPVGPDGIAVIDKAAEWTSHDVVAKARGVLGTRKVGHRGRSTPMPPACWCSGWVVPPASCGS
jgi:tRNA pseudouridine55 synthase